LVPIVLVVCSPQLAAAEDLPRTGAPLPPALEKTIPESLEDLRAIEAHVKTVVERVLPCTVGIRLGPNQGSGVIVSKDGFVLTAGHVSGQPDRDVQIILPSGKKLKGKTLGANRGIDSGLIKIIDAGDWPFVEMAQSKPLKKGQWCLATGHPNGYQNGRAPVVRLGRVLEVTKSHIRTDCALVGGDSGGPLFDMHGRVIGIHSRIGNSLASNIHVPVDTYRESWDRLAKGEVWGGGLLGTATDAYLGVRLDPEAKNCKISVVAEGSPAEKAGLKVNDIVLSADGKKVSTGEEFRSFLSNKKPGVQLTLQVRRGEETITLKVTVGKRPT
jgi:serine protease Do